MMKTARIAAGLLTFSAVAVTASAGQASNLITDGGFEIPALSSKPTFGPGAIVSSPVPNYVYPNGTYDSWTYAFTAGLVDTSQKALNGFYGTTPPSGYQGKQFAFIQDDGELSQAFISATTGRTTISWLEGGRPAGGGGTHDGNQIYEVLLNGKVLGTYSTTSGQNFTAESVSGFLQLGFNTLEFLGETSFTGPYSGDHTAFIDSVGVSRGVPEPSTWAMMLAGFAGLAFLGYRRDKAATLAA